MNQLNFEKILEETEDLKPEDGSVFKFSNAGDHIVARYIGRRRDIKTKTGTAIALDCEILASTVIGDKSVTGAATIFESSHVTQLMDRANLSPGDVFVLKLDSVDRKSRFKRFAFKKITDGSEEEPPDDYEPEPPPEVFKRR